MKKIVITFFVIGFSTTSFAAKISLETAGLCYEATRQSTKMAMLLDPDAAEYKHLNNNTKELFGTLSGGPWEKRIQRKYGMPGKPSWIMPEWKVAWLNLMDIGK